MIKKIELTKKLIANSSSIFMCPICGSEMMINKFMSLCCRNRHNFDLSRQGYINMLLKQVKSDYDKKMFESRNMISKSGFFTPMLNLISNLILEETLKNKMVNSNILDAGCGEGSHLSRILMNLRENRSINFSGVGIDISKEGIRLASREYMNIIWCVADLSKIPLKNDQFDIVLNILSPANYGEFNRVLNNQGLLIKVVPGNNYLIELREILFKGTSKQFYLNNRVVQHFSDNFKIINKQPILYKVNLNNENIEHLIKMTPLVWNAEKEKLEEIIRTGIKNITVAFEVIVGKK